jgi:polysaccharide export outer membrane protein
VFFPVFSAVVNGSRTFVDIQDLCMKKFRVLAFASMLFCGLTVFGQADIQATAKSTTAPMPSVSSKDFDENQYHIGLQDILEIQIMRLPDLNQRVSVGPQGTIALFRLDRPLVAICKTTRELANDIAKAYVDAKYLKDPQVNVMVSEQKSQSLGVIGAVEKPGNFFISRRVHLLELLSLAGGPSKEAGTRLLVARAGSSSGCQQANSNDDIEVMNFKIRDVEEGKQTLWMQPGDVVSVLDADIIYMYGSLNKQGALKIKDPITLTQAIASAEGLKQTAKTDKVRVLRQIPGKADRDEFIFDLGMISKGKVKDPYLQPNDIVAISQDTTKAILHSVADTMKGAVPAAIYTF